MKQSITIFAASAAITAGLMLAKPALAEPVQPAQTFVSLVKTADLDLRTDAGREALNHRLANAAREVCGTASDVDIKGKNDVRRCRNDTLARASSQTDSVLAAAERGAVIAVSASR